MTLSELIENLSRDNRLHIFDCKLATDDWWDDLSNTDPVVFFGDVEECPKYLFERKISMISVSDEYVNCLSVELR